MFDNMINNCFLELSDVIARLLNWIILKGFCGLMKFFLADYSTSFIIWHVTRKSMFLWKSIA